MLKHISVQNFKSLKEVAFDPVALNVLMGLNGVGKSSFNQMLLLLKQINVNARGIDFSSLSLNGEIVSLGTLKDILYCYSDTEKMTFCFFEDSSVGDIGIEIPTQSISPDCDNLDLLIKMKEVSSKDGDVNGSFERFCGWCRKIQYISANRLGPQQEHLYYTSKIGEKNWGSCGENSVAYLAEYGNQKISSKKLLFSEDFDGSLQTQVNGWMSIISPGTNIHADKMVNISKALLSISFAKGIAQNRFRPQNVGFGISYTLPIIIMLLTAKSGDCLIIENPEAHIHPKGQAELGRLLALCASTGVQIFLETHSDHVVNGIRVAVKKGQIERHDVKIAYFSRKESYDNGIYEQYTDIETIKIDPHGELSSYPDGFMDEWNNQLMELL